MQGECRLWVDCDTASLAQLPWSGLFKSCSKRKASISFENFENEWTKLHIGPIVRFRIYRPVFHLFSFLRFTSNGCITCDERSQQNPVWGEEAGKVHGKGSMKAMRRTHFWQLNSRLSAQNVSLHKKWKVPLFRLSRIVRKYGLGNQVQEILPYCARILSSNFRKLSWVFTELRNSLWHWLLIESCSRDFIELRL